MRAHAQFADDLTLHALGALQGEDKRVLEQHLASCATCRTEFTELQADTALLALSAEGPAPSERVREKLINATLINATLIDKAAIDKATIDRATIGTEKIKTATVDAKTSPPTPETQPVIQVVPRRRPWALAFSFSMAAVLILVAASLWNENRGLKSSLADANRNYTQQQDQLIQAQDLVNTLTSQESRRITLVAAKSTPQPQGKVFYLPGKAHLVFLASNMAPLPPDRVYELWLIPVTGAPIPAGLFKADAHGSGSIVNPPLQAGVEAKAFAITVEPEAGSIAPTSQIIMLGAGE